MNTLKRSVLVSMVALSVLAGPVTGQDGRKPPPPTVDGGYAPPPPADPYNRKKPGPDTGTAAMNRAMEVDQRLVGDWLKAYRASGKPRILVLAGLDHRPFTQGAPAAGNAGPQGIQQGGVGSKLADFDPSGLTEQLGMAFMEILNPDGTVRLVDLEAVADEQRRQIATLERNFDDGAAERLATQLNADLVLTFKFQPVPASLQIGDRATPYKATAKLTDMTRRQQLYNQIFDWDGSTEVQNIRRYAAALSQDLMAKYVRTVIAADGLTQIELRWLGLRDDRQARDIRRAMRDIKGIDGRITMDEGSMDSGGKSDVATGFSTGMTFDYDGDTADLLDELEAVVKKDLGVDFVVEKRDANVITLRVGGPAVAPAPEWWVMTVTKSDTRGVPEGAVNPVRQPFLDAYAAKGKPRIAVALGWLANPADVRAMENWQWWIAGEDLVQRTGLPSTDMNFQAPNVIPVEKMKTILEGILADDVGVRTVDINSVRNAYQKSKERLKLAGQEANGIAIAMQNECDFLMYGWCDPRTAEYTLKIVDVRTGSILGTQVWPDKNLELTRRILKDYDLNNPQDFGRALAGNLLVKWKDKLMQPSELAVVVKNARDANSVRTVAKALKANLEQVTRADEDVEFSYGLGKFTIEYDGSYASLTEQIARQADRLPFALVTDEQNSGTLVLNAREVASTTP
jgi:hypothetical protein